MTIRPTPRISARKQPKQERSRQVVAAILTAAGRVLAREGVRRFTAARVAVEAGVSVGSLYQYFPNKEAILFRLQADEWKETGGLLGGIIADATLPPLERLRAAVHEFIRSECEEAGMRAALDDAERLYRDAPEARRLRLAVTRTVRAFMREALPHTPQSVRIVAADVMMTAMEAVGKQISEGEYAPAAIDARARALADMFCAYLDTLRASVDV
ncbi:transcriptional regulator, TetR family [Rhodoblastus acidophilus]|uniref:Transcriptional regulator, TetR family n=1 Tax=Rhodoblastus acidophilus TaxID=1074 RepID=A0A212S8C6_RHOAC|nr:TetR family transcriptional regulator [Rhodoblastus acidophilus]PPQ36817.1 TetR/AcrR family transcriptional regulator [Rhodoblastus acidophilus]RAI21401.1 TetR/AcrR family transcriptional regulator [Rhodoblastus acidophilus]SNB81618.1 transcriptional regulator, TetR family [Rhodoblastus acidophilus]